MYNDHMTQKITRMKGDRMPWEDTKSNYVFANRIRYVAPENPKLPWLKAVQKFFFKLLLNAF